MEETLDRRNARHERIPLRLSAELGHGDFEDPFAADVLNLSTAGISMRAACLPDIGSRLSCRFRCVPSGALVCAEGEVVWAHLDGEQSGEFGLSFLDLDPQTEWLIEEMLAEQVACSGSSSQPPVEVSAKVATLELEGIPESIDARLASEGRGRAVFEQELELLRVGRGVRALTDGAHGRQGSIAAVELRMVGSVPMLAVTVEFAGRSEPGSAAPALTADDASEVHDTEPDLEAPMTSDAELDAALAGPPRPSEAPEAAMPADTAARAEAELERPEPAKVIRPPVREREVSAAFKIPAGDDDPALDFEAMVRPSLATQVQRAWAELTRSLGPQLAQLRSAAARSALPQLRGALLRAAGFVRALYARTLGPQFGAVRRLLIALLTGRRRRTTAGPGQSRWSGSLLRTLLLGLLGAGAAAYAVQALLPSDGDRIELHRKVAPETAAAAAQPATAPASASGARALPKGAAPDPRAVPNASSVPAGSPFAVDVRGARASAPTSAAPAKPAAPAAPAAAAPAAPKQLRFGAASVPNARRFALRMSTRVQNLSGVADAGGFTITAQGSLSLDRAGPIASAHKSVARAMIINKGDRAELSIRFADGKKPAYQVNAEGSTLYILIQDG